MKSCHPVWPKTAHSRRRNATARLHLERLEGRVVPAVRYPDFQLPDLNPNSSTSGQNVGPSDYIGTVSGYYFTSAG
jgi:hypothetical protein